MEGQEMVVALEAPPRTLDVQHFAKARSSELLALHASLKLIRSAHAPPGSNNKSSVPASLPRHLRRRTSSYNRRPPLPGLYRQKKNRKAPDDPKLQPRKKRKLAQTAPQATAATTTSAVSDAQVNEAVVKAADGPPKKRLCRRLRRKLELKAGSCLMSGDGSRRLATHVWHAKRFSMTKRWGYCVPLGRPGRGHGSRAILRWSKDAALLQDASFYNAIQLSGSQEWLVRAMQAVLEPPPAVDSSCEAAQLELSGACFGTAVLHHIGRAPCETIAPVLFAWRPVVSKQGHSSGSLKGQSEGLKERDLWVWVHAAAFDEAFQSLQAACCKQNEEFSDATIHCFSRRGDLGRIDLLGSKSFQVLQKVLFPVYRAQQWNNTLAEGNSRKLLELPQLVQPDQLPRKAVITMEVLDPRQNQIGLCPYVPSSQDDPEVSSCKLLNSSGKENTRAQELDAETEMTMDGEVLVEHGGTRMDQQQHREEDFSQQGGLSKESFASDLQASKALWASPCGDAGNIIRPPMSEKILCKMRHMQRLASYELDEVAASSSRRSEKDSTLSERCICPIILLKHDSQKPSACGWSIILPLSWVWAFWVPLVFAGGHVIGLRERHWLSTDAGLPSFPEDFPDSPACARHMAAESAAYAEEMSRRPHSKRPSSVPIPSQWDHVFESSHKDGVEAFCSSELQSGLKLTPGDNHSDSKRLLGADVNSGFVARTAAALTSFLRKFNETRLLLFPEEMQTIGRFRTLCERLKGGTLAWHVRMETCGSDNAAKAENVCYLRVCIHPLRKGVMEVGATVYAPTSEDFGIWLSKTKRSKQLPMTISASGQNGTAIGQDGPRKPIGFVTSAAPRGSKMASAIAFCDAVALGQIRARQWAETRWQNDQEVFLMARNKGSNMYRPALASIKLEEGPDVV